MRLAWRVAQGRGLVPDDQQRAKRLHYTFYYQVDQQRAHALALELLLAVWPTLRTL
jgi:hypothetical protein